MTPEELADIMRSGTFAVVNPMTMDFSPEIGDTSLDVNFHLIANAQMVTIKTTVFGNWDSGRFTYEDLEVTRIVGPDHQEMVYNGEFDNDFQEAIEMKIQHQNSESWKAIL